jgi:uncharacterized protein
MGREIVRGIERRLDDAAASHGVTIPLAVESGSRAWGFPSPDSDYDCRFIFVRHPRDYMAIWRKRDVIETPLDKIYDVNGWDLAKAVGLLLKGNAVVIEWLLSPIAYRRDEPFASALLDLAREVAIRERVIYHYLHLGERQRRTYFGDGKAVRRKKIFYALRPAAAIRWLRLNPQTAIAPMNFLTLMAECDAPPAVSAIVYDMLAEKSAAADMGVAELPREIAAFIDDEFAAARAEKPRAGDDIERANRERAESFFAEWVERIAILKAVGEG